jgi:NAD(P)-dependent dehydrogenase (short-subunit alcohol dehydrogenase family)
MSGKILDGRVALVTGASRGIGLAIAQRLASEGARVAVTARTVEPGPLAGTIHESVDLIRAAGGEAAAVAADLSHADERERLIQEVVRQLGPIDILVNNAAVAFFTSVQDYTAKRFDLMFEVEVTAPFHLSQMVLPSMIEKGQGWIVNVSSRAALNPTQPYQSRGGGATVYGMCKAALERFSTGLASEVYDANIAVNALSPNRVVPTPGTVFHGLVDDPDRPVEQPQVMAEAALALCSVEPKLRTGRITYSQDLLNELNIVL